MEHIYFRTSVEDDLGHSRSNTPVMPCFDKLIVRSQLALLLLEFDNACAQDTVLLNQECAKAKVFHRINVQSKSMLYL